MSAYRDQLAPDVPDVLILSGLDPSGGAGFLADARVVHMLGGRPVGAITAMTVQDTRGMRSAHEIDIDVLGAQLNALLTDIEVKAVKIGMLADRDIIDILDEALELTNAPVVWDPIAAPTHGQVSFGREVLDDALRKLGPHLALITPNAVELGLLAGAEVTTLVEAVEGAKMFARISNVAVLVKGGHIVTTEDETVDVLCLATGEVEYLRGPRITTDDVHGTGCALSSAIATYLALGHPLIAACRDAKDFVAKRIANAVRAGRGAPSVL